MWLSTIGSQCNEDIFQDEEYRMLFADMIARYETGITHFG